jgi:hypothetical protein
MSTAQPTEIVVEHAEGSMKPLVMRWQGKGIRFQQVLWHRPEIRNGGLHQVFCLSDDSLSYTLDFDTRGCKWNILRVEPLAA